MSTIKTTLPSLWSRLEKLVFPRIYWQRWVVEIWSLLTCKGQLVKRFFLQDIRFSFSEVIRFADKHTFPKKYLRPLIECTFYSKNLEFYQDMSIFDKRELKHINFQIRNITIYIEYKKIISFCNCQSLKKISFL